MRGNSAGKPLRRRDRVFEHRFRLDGSQFLALLKRDPPTRRILSAEDSACVSRERLFHTPSVGSDRFERQQARPGVTIRLYGRSVRASRLTASPDERALQEINGIDNRFRPCARPARRADV